MQSQAVATSRNSKLNSRTGKRRTKTIDLYLQGIITRLDQLAILGKVVDHEDQIDLILDGLPEEYKSVIDQVEERDTPPSITELHERLLNHEAKLLSSNDTVVLHTPVIVNVAHQRYNNSRNNNKQKQNNQWPQQTHQQWQTHQQSNRQDYRG